MCGISSAYKSGAKTSFFSMISQLNGLCLQKERRYRPKQLASALATTSGLLHNLKMSWTLDHKRLQIGPPFYPPYVNSALYFIAKLRRWRSRSEKGTQPNFDKRWTVNWAKNVRRKVGSSVPNKLGPNDVYICSVFGRLRDIMANIFWTKRDIDNRQRHWKYEGSPILSQSFVNFGPQTA